LRPLLRIKRLSWFDYAFIVFLGSLTLYNDEGKLGPHQSIVGVCSQLVALVILSLFANVLQFKVFERNGFEIEVYLNTLKK